jgi:uncharacterized protein (TIGR01777 family)
VAPGSAPRPAPTRASSAALALAEHVATDEPFAFRDVQRAGPCARWDHPHVIAPVGADTLYRDRLEHALPMGALGELVAGARVRRRIDRRLEHRHGVLAADLQEHRRRRAEGTMRIVVTGSSGLVGGALVPFLETGGHEVLRAVRGGTSGAGQLAWRPGQGGFDAAALEGVDAVVHLAGENIADGRWTAKRKEAIRRSRVQGTAEIAKALAGLARKPKVLACASAIGFYGDRFEELLDESSGRGSGFLAEVCEAWERAADPARQAGIRVVHLRFGMVLSPRGGALAKMIGPFKLGVGGPVGSGRQYWSWVHLDDAVGATHHALVTESAAGAVNVVAPAPERCRDFARTLGKVLSRPALLPLPGFAARLAFGEMADELLLASQRVVPRQLERAGYRFRHPELEEALRALLGR